MKEKMVIRDKKDLSWDKNKKNKKKNILKILKDSDEKTIGIYK